MRVEQGRRVGIIVGHQVAMAGEASTPACLHKSISLFLNSLSIQCFPLFHLCILTCLCLSSTAPSQGPEQAHEQVPQPLRSENPRAQIARVILSMHKQAPFAQYTVPFLVHRTGSVVGDRYVYTHPA